jgi:wobble nucleotide-excising tRNase
MLRKLISIRNVGRFLAYSAGGDVELKRYNLVFAENGRGKTTLCAIFRSLHSGDAALVKGRATLGITAAPDIRILRADNQVAAFSNGTWNGTLPQFAIFDSTFIAENVYSGDSVDLDHRKRLYGVIVGKPGAELARRIDELDNASREKSTDIREKRAAVQALAQGLTPEAFMALPADPAIDATILAKEGELAAVRQADQIRARAPLAALALPALPDGIPALLARTLDGVSADAERRVREQIATHEMHRRGQGWLSEGLGFIRGDSCPFCGQGLAGADLIAAYKAYFSEEYERLRQAVGTLRQQVDTALNERVIAGVERTLDQNTAAAEFWSGYCQLTAPTMPAGTAEALRALREAALSLLDRKAAAPLEALAPDAAFTGAVVQLGTLQTEAAAYNEAVAAANAVIAAKKAATQAADIKTVQADLARLRATKARHEPAGDAACRDLRTALAEKENIEQEKDGIRKKLDQYAKDVMAQYEKTINRLLTEFQAGFRIAGTTQSYAGGSVSSTYKLMINDTPVELGNAETAPDTPSFRNTLSSGDKSTLALAFFLAQLEHDGEKAGRIVVFDDPFNSQDGFRKDCTIQKIKRCGSACAQVIVLSHDPDFLKRIWDRLEPADRKCLKLARVGMRDTTIVPLDIEQATQAAYLAQRKVLLDYYHDAGGVPLDVVQKIRPVLESWCKILGPGLLAEADTLGVIVGKIRTDGQGHQLFALADALEDLNDYTKRYHHGDNPNAATEPLSETELQGKVGLTLELTGGC